MQEYAKAMLTAPDKPLWLTILGDSDQGKTFAATKLFRLWKNCHEWQHGHRRHWQCRAAFATWGHLLAKLKDKGWGLRSDLQETPFLCLDDIGAARHTEFARTELYDLLNARIGKWTVITGNLSLAEVSETIDERLASRIERDGNLVLEL